MGESWSWDSQTSIFVKDQAEYVNRESNILIQEMFQAFDEFNGDFNKHN